jgi:hypothetical protein
LPPRIELQLKCTSDSLRGEHVVCRLKSKNYNDLRLDDLVVPRILVVLLVPRDESEWFQQTEAELSRRRCAYWISLGGPGSRDQRRQSHDQDPARALTFRHPSFPNADLVLPTQRDLGDFTLRMADVVVALATIEQRSAWEVLNDLSGPPGDVFRLRVVAPDATLGNLPLEEGIKLLQGGRDLLSAAAYSTHQPRALHPQKMPKDVREFLGSCRLGQTERGSFVATVIAPVPPEIPQSIAFGDEEFLLDREPYPRRVTTHLMSALGLISDGIQSGRPGRILEVVEKGVRANLCEALKTMKPAGDQSRLDISVSWARTRSRVPENVPQAVSFPQESFAFIEEAGRELRTRAFARRERYQGRLLIAQRVDRPLFHE